MTPPRTPVGPGTTDGGTVDDDGVVHDPWWGEIDASHVAASRSADVATDVAGSASDGLLPPARSRTKRTKGQPKTRTAGAARATTTRRGTKRPARTSLAGRIMRELRSAASSSERFRRVMIVGTITGVVLIGLTCSVGVIMLNNLVIKRSAELGRLDASRKKLRSENARISADVARLSAPPRVAELATKRLGMVPATRMPDFIFLDPDNRPVTTLAAQRRARRLARQQAQAVAAAKARAAAAAATENSATTSLAATTSEAPQ